MAGITLWNYFSTCLTTVSGVFNANAGIFGKVYFPRLIMPLTIVISNLISIRDWFYFCACPAYTENQHIRNLFKMKPDGSQMTLIRDGEVDNLNIAGNDLLFSDMSKNGIIIKWNLDDFSETNLTSEPAKQILVDEKAIYYLDKEDILYSLDFSGDNKYQICRDPISIYNISEDWIYFSNKKDHNYLYRIRKDGVNQTRINQDVSLQIYVNGVRGL